MEKSSIPVNNPMDITEAKRIYQHYLTLCTTVEYNMENCYLYLVTDDVTNIADPKKAKKPQNLNKLTRITDELIALPSSPIELVAILKDEVDKSVAGIINGKVTLDDMKSGSSFDRRVVIRRMCDALIGIEKTNLLTSRPFHLNALQRFQFTSKVSEKQLRLLTLLEKTTNVLLSTYMEGYFPTAADVRQDNVSMT